MAAHTVTTRPRINIARLDAFENAVVCKHCQRSDPASSSCFAVIRYPEWWGERPRSRVVQGRGRGSNSGSQTIGRGRNVNYANDVHVPPPPIAEQANYTITDADRDGVSCLNDTQWRLLMNLLNGGASTSTEKLSGTSFVSS